MREMMLDGVHRARQGGLVDPALGGHQLPEGVEGLAPAPHPGEVPEPGRMLQREPDLAGAVGGSVASHGHGVDVGQGEMRVLQASQDRQTREPREVPHAVQAFLGHRHDRATIDDERGRGPGMEGVDAENHGHGGDCVTRVFAFTASRYTLSATRISTGSRRLIARRTSDP